LCVYVRGGVWKWQGGGWLECVCWAWKLGKERTLEADLCNTDPTSLQAGPGLGGEIFGVLGYLDEDCFYYHSWRNNVVIAFVTLSSFLT